MRVIKGKIAVVTGAASGLGKAIALRLAREGAHLHLIDIDQAGAEQTASEARSLGVQAACDRRDLSQAEEVRAAAQSLLERWGHADILVNNAGIAFYGPTLSMTDQQWDKLMAINLEAPILLTRLLLPTLLERPEAHIVNMASICGWVSGARFSAYNVSKFAMVGFSEAMRAEYYRMGLGVTAVCPGPIRTKLYERADCGIAGRKTPTPAAWLCASPERVAQKTVRAIYRNKAVTLITPLAYLLYYTKRFAPWLLYWSHGIGRNRKLRKKAADLAAKQSAPQPIAVAVNAAESSASECSANSQGLRKSA